MHQTKKGNQWHFGMTAHIGVDSETGIVQHPFLRLKRLFGYAKVRYRGLAKNAERLPSEARRCPASDGRYRGGRPRTPGAILAAQHDCRTT